MNNSIIILEDLKHIVENRDINWNKLENSTVIITGATGMLGQYIVKVMEFLNEFFNMNINIIKLGRKDMLIDKMIVNCDYFIHAASPARKDACTNPFKVFNVNVYGCDRVLKFLAKNKNKLKAFVFLSSGDALENFDHRNIDNCYGMSKRTAEALLCYYRELYCLPTYITRFDHTFAPTMNLYKDTRVFAQIVRAIVEDTELVIKNSRAKRTFTYITDAMDGFFRSFLNGNTDDYNISNIDNFLDINSIINNLFDNNTKIEIRYGFTDVKSPLSIFKLEQLGYIPKVSAIYGFKRVIKHFQEIKNA
jgi:UDP-glucuronate decarboxylase